MKTPAAAIWSKCLENMWHSCDHFYCKKKKTSHRHAAVESPSMCNHYDAPITYTNTCNWRVSAEASFKRQPEKKDALLMRRRGPCSEKARRGLQSWENPAQHKQKNMEQKRGRRKGENKDKKTWTMVSLWISRKVGSLLSSDQPRVNDCVTGAF